MTDIGKKKKIVDEDKSIVLKILNNDSKAFETLFRKYCQKLIDFSYLYLKDKSMAENVVQDIFLKIWKNKTNLNPTYSIKSYLYTSVKNESLKIIRHLQIVQAHEQNQSNNDLFEKSPEEILTEKEQINIVRQAIYSLSEKSRIVFSMSKYEKLTYREIAEILNISIKTVETHMGRAFKHLKNKLSNILFFFVGVFTLLGVLILGRI